MTGDQSHSDHLQTADVIDPGPLACDAADHRAGLLEAVVEDSTPASSPHPKRCVVAGVCVALVLACVAIYGRTLSHEFLNYDDPLYVTDNRTVQAGLSWANISWAFTTSRAMYMHPLTWISHMVDCEIYGLHPWGHHLTNLIFHTINSMLLFFVFARITRSLWPSALVAALFAVHPLHVESVAWIAERKDVLSMLFWTGSLGAYAWYRQRPGLARYLAVALLFFLGLMSKPMVVTLPFVLLLLDYWPLNQINPREPFGVTARKAMWLTIEKIPLFMMTALFCVITFMMQLRGNNLVFGDKVPFLARCANALVVYVIYLVKTVWPLGLAAHYEHPITRPVWQVAGAAVILIAITLFCLRHARRRPYLVVGWFWYLGTLVPVIELVQAGNFSHADRYTYIPLVGVFIMIAWGAADLAAAWRAPKHTVAIASGIVLVMLTACSVIQTGYWHDSEKLFQHTIAAGYESGTVYNNLGKLALDSRRYDEARRYLKKALDIKPDHVDALGNMGKLALERGQYDEARGYLTRTVELRPDHVNALVNLGLLSTNQWRYLDAKTYLTKALDLNPGHIDALNNLGVLALNQWNYDEARGYLTKALDLEPDNASVLNNLGWCLMKQGQYEQARQHFRKALEIDPHFVNAMNNLGLVLSNLGQEDEASEYFKKAAESNQASVTGDLGARR